MQKQSAVVIGYVLVKMRTEIFPIVIFIKSVVQYLQEQTLNVCEFSIINM